MYVIYVYIYCIICSYILEVSFHNMRNCIFYSSLYSNSFSFNYYYTCIALFIFAIILGFRLLASDLLLGLNASKSAGFLVGLAVSSTVPPLLLRSALLLRLLLRLVEPDRVPETFLLLLDELEGSTCCGRGVDFPEPGALPEVGFLIVLECEPQVPIVMKHTSNVRNKSDKK